MLLIRRYVGLDIIQMTELYENVTLEQLNVKLDIRFKAVCNSAYFCWPF